MKSIDEIISFVIKSRLIQCDKEVHFKFVKKVNRYCVLFSLLPFVKQTVICNNLAFNCVNKNSDIDLLIILDYKRFYIGRLFVTVMFHLLKIRRHGNRIAGRFCLSFYINDQDLSLKKAWLGPLDFYFAFWLKNLIFLSDDFVLYKRFLEANNLNEKNQAQLFKIYSKLLITKIIELVLRAKLFDFVENFAKNFQISRAMSKYKELQRPQGVIIEDGFLKFHDKDARLSINMQVIFFLCLDSHLKRLQ